MTKESWKKKKIEFGSQQRGESPVTIINGNYAGFCPFTKISPYLIRIIDPDRML